MNGRINIGHRLRLVLFCDVLKLSKVEFKAFLKNSFCHTFSQ